jgi:TRAP-type C4-dicarboxylate transport system permease small subunit
MWFSCCSLAGMMLILAVDVGLRSGIDVVVPGTVEIVQFLMVLVVFFSLAYTSLGSGHVTINLFTARFPERIQVGLDSFSSLLGVLIFAGIGWQLGSRGWHNIFVTNPKLTYRLLIPYYPFLFMAALGSVLFSLHLLMNFCHGLAQIVRK